RHRRLPHSLPTRRSSDLKQLQQIELIATPTDHDMTILENEFNIKSVHINQSLAFQCEKEKIPELVRSLVSHDIDIYQISKAKARDRKSTRLNSSHVSISY